MRLKAISEDSRTRRFNRQAQIPPLRNAEEADALFRVGLRAIHTRNASLAFRIFERLSRYEGDAPPGLVDAARLARDFVARGLSPAEKAIRSAPPP